MISISISILFNIYIHHLLKIFFTYFKILNIKQITCGLCNWENGDVGKLVKSYYNKIINHYPSWSIRPGSSQEPPISDTKVWQIGPTKTNRGVRSGKLGPRKAHVDRMLLSCSNLSTGLWKFLFPLESTRNSAKWTVNSYQDALNLTFS